MPYSVESLCNVKKDSRVHAFVFRSSWNLNTCTNINRTKVFDSYCPGKGVRIIFGPIGCSCDQLAPLGYEVPLRSFYSPSVLRQAITSSSPLLIDLFMAILNPSVGAVSTGLCHFYNNPV
jgi:hypothetical protein